MMIEKYFYYYDRKYKIDEYGTVIKCAYADLRKYNYSGKIVKKVMHRPDKVLKPYTDRDGYLDVQLACNDKSDPYRVHHLVYMIFHDGVTDITHKRIGYDFETHNYIQINHIDGNKNNNHYTNLELVTLQENIKHAVITGIHNSQTNAKYVEIYRNNTYVDTIWKTREACEYIYNKFGVKIDCGSLSRCARNGKSYKGFTFKYKV